MTEVPGSIPKHLPCRGVRRDGQSCRAPGLLDGWCFAHHPERAADRQASREKGGRGKATAARAEKLVPTVLRPVLDTLLAAVGEVKDGTLTTQQAGALSSLAGAIVKVYQVGTLEERLTALEAAQQASDTRRAG
jgi:hypothetical protein